ncbi:MAG: hypothetical protein IKA94_00335, partial [Mogibacterium sp.]|nr:hypothetical protein [Mogibacterium sp.]
MSKLIKKNRITIALILIVILVTAGICIYRSRSTKLIDKDVYSAFRTSVEDFAATEAGGFSDQQELMTFIE